MARTHTVACLPSSPTSAPARPRASTCPRARTDAPSGQVAATMSSGARGHSFELSRATLERNLMESTVSRPAVDVGTSRPRPGLALLLSLLAIPGSTVAWDLPHGGLWIGLPLAIAAIVIALRARRELAGGRGTGMATAALVIAGLCIAQMAVWTVAELVS